MSFPSPGTLAERTSGWGRRCRWTTSCPRLVKRYGSLGRVPNGIRSWLPRDSASRQTGKSNADRPAGRVVRYEDILQRVEERVWHLPNLVRTVRESTYSRTEWDTDFRTQWTPILRDAGRAIGNPDADVEPIQDRLDRRAEDMGKSKDLPNKYWPVYGSVIMSMRHIASIVDDVVSTCQARETDQENPRV